MTKWWDMFGVDHPEAFGKIENPEDKIKHLYTTDVPDITMELLLAICNNLKIDTSFVWNRYAKTLKEQKKEHRV